jgi:hypothetical protein
VNEETKGKLVDGAIVAAKATALIGGQVLLAGVASAIHPAHGVRTMMRVAIPRPINMWKNQRAQRAAEEERAAIIADGCFRYRDKYRVRFSSQNARWEWGEVDPADGKMWLDGQGADAKDCMRQIDKLVAS